MIVLLIEMIVCMLLLMGIYQLLLVKTAMHKLKRFYLILCLILPIALPFVELQTSNIQIPTIEPGETITSTFLLALDTEQSIGKVADSPESVIPSTTTTKHKSANAISYKTWLITLYFLVVLILLIRYTLSIRMILKSVKTTSIVTFQGNKVQILDRQIVPHNFMHLIFISQEDYNNEAIRNRLLTHELSHARQFHSIDILLVEFLRILFWINPLYIFWSKAIRANHEYLADAVVVNQFSDISTYQKLLLNFGGHKTSGPRLTSPSNYSLTKRRFIMMTKKISKTSIFLRMTILIPLLVITTAAMTLKTSAGETFSAVISNSEFTHKAFEGDKPAIFPIDQKFNPQFLIHFDATMYRGTDREHNHQGVDYRATLGTAVRATADGIVISSQKNEKHGNHIVIKHNDEYQTLYASLNELMVVKNQQVKKGMTIGTVGKSIENSNIHLHYEVIKNGKQVDPKEYYLLKKTPKFLRDIHRINLEVKGFIIAKKHGLGKPVRSAHFPEGWKYSSIVYDRNKIIFLGSDTGEARTVNMTDLNDMQKEGLRGLKSDLRSIAKTPLKDEIVQEWQDPDKYLVIIDGKLIENNTLSDFNPETVAFFWKVKLRKNDPKKPVYRIDILSENAYQELLEEEQTEILTLEKANKAFLEMIDKH